MVIKKIAVAMSGGVDSAVSAFLLKQQGHNIIGITLKLVDNKLAHSYEKSCCSLESSLDAKKVCAKINIPHYVLNLEKEFKNFVINPFIKNYLKGKTPNPCINCNEKIKFSILLKQIKSLGFDYLATGHYAKNFYAKEKKEYYLKKAKDKAKDQSYFLYSLTQKELPYILFPLENLAKVYVREIAKKNNLGVEQKEDSQEICFVPNGDYKKMFINNFEKYFQIGNIINMQGKVIGKHKGIVFYTRGQRKGLGIASPHPLYVIKIDYKKNMIIADKEKYLFNTTLIAKNVSWVNKIRKNKFLAWVKIRSNSKVQKGEVQIIKDKVRVRFEKPQRAITSGQAVVFYKYDIVLGGGIIVKAN